jgi:NADPH-dependent curcumin reductase CurA
VNFGVIYTLDFTLNLEGKTSTFYYISIRIRIVGKSTKKFILKKRPSGEVSADNFELIEENLSNMRQGEILVKVKYLSVDPYMRNRMNNVESYVSPFDLNSVITGDGIGEVVETKSDKFKTGDMVVGILPWQEYALIDPKKLEKIYPDEAESSTAYLSVMGLTGLTAYFGLLDIGDPKPGETVVISAAAGAVGSVAGQIARINGCKVFGIAGGEKKYNYLKNDLLFDEAIDYKKTPNIRKELRKICPQKIDIYFDNVGGDISDSVFYLLNNHARIVLCGQISLYNLNRLSMGPRLYPQFLIRRVKMQGFIVYDYAKQFSIARDQIKQWIQEGKIKYDENIIDGFENLPIAFLGLFRGDNIGKQLVKV